MRTEIAYWVKPSPTPVTLLSFRRKARRIKDIPPVPEDMMPPKPPKKARKPATLSERYSQYRSSAFSRRISFMLSMEEFGSFWGKPCSYCGAKIEAIGVDRADNSRGYEVENCVPCCFMCNMAKRDGTVQKFLEHCRRVAAFNDGAR